MKTLTKLFVLFALCMTLGGVAHAQTSLTQTTLNGAISDIGAPTFTLASVTGLSAGNIVYIDHEAIAVAAVNTTTLIVTGTRGQLGTRSTTHASGTIVMFGPVGGFQVVDPYGSCTAAAQPFTPYLNAVTGAQWLCSSITGTWVPGWQNPLGNPVTWGQTATVASAAGAITPSGPYFIISGTAAITGFNIPVGFNGTLTGGGCFTANPSGIWTWTAAGNIATAGTTTAATTPVTFCWNASTLKWVPSRLA